MSVGRVVVVIDDDIGVLNSFKFLLEAAGYPVAAYGSASAFLDDRGIEPGCLIVDQHMPVMTGLDLVAHLRQEAIFIPALLMTGLPSPKILARANELGIEVLEKPPNEHDVLRFINVHF